MTIHTTTSTCTTRQDATTRARARDHHTGRATTTFEPTASDDDEAAEIRPRMPNEDRPPRQRANVEIVRDATYPAPSPHAATRLHDSINTHRLRDVTQNEMRSHEASAATAHDHARQGEIQRTMLTDGHQRTDDLGHDHKTSKRCDYATRHGAARGDHNDVTKQRHVRRPRHPSRPSLVARHATEGNLVNRRRHSPQAATGIAVDMAVQTLESDNMMVVGLHCDRQPIQQAPPL